MNPTAHSKTEPDDFVKGADISLLKRIEDAGGVYREQGKVKDPLQIFKDHGFNYMRLRLFHTPINKGAQVNTLEYTLELGERIKAKGFKFLLNFHYSDEWAYPGKQYPPAVWKGLSHEQLVEQVFGYTRDVISACRQHKCRPDIVQVGNEITPGMLWEDGRVAGEFDTKQSKWINQAREYNSDSAQARWRRFADLVKAGIRGVSAGAGQPVRTMVHSDRGADLEANKWFFDNLLAQGVDFDVIGLSYYPYWHGPLDNLRQNLIYAARRYRKDIHIVETDYPWKPEQPLETSAASSPGENAQSEEYLPSPEGQKAFLQELIRVVKDTPDNRGKGIFYWAPEWIELKDYPDEPDAPTYWAKALFDENGNMLPGMEAFQD